MPASMQRFAIAAPICVLPQPDAPTSTPALRVLGEAFRVVDAAPEEVSSRLWRYLQRHGALSSTIVSIGIPILQPDGRRLLRGPRVNVPEYAGQPAVPLAAASVNEWADRGWIDLRPENIRLWQDRFRRMLRSAQTIHRQGSAAITMEAYRSEEIRIGEVVGWIFNNEEEGYRIK